MTEENVGQQFLDRVQPLLGKLRKRPISQQWSNHGYSIEENTVHRDFGRRGLNLYHDGRHQGIMNWNPDTGFVYLLELGSQHKHMAGKLLQEAWDLSTSEGGRGPSWSNQLNTESERLVARWNPESEGLRQHREKHGRGEQVE